MRYAALCEKLRRVMLTQSTHICKNIWHKIIVVFYILLNPFCVKQRIFDFMWHYIDIIINLWYKAIQSKVFRKNKVNV
mgnify:CR=1 FL=1